MEKYEQQQKNHTGMPEKLKQGMEKMSGYDMSDVKVHYNSMRPAQFHALAFTQGTDIHVAPGQEKHLAHEAWHVVQQKQGRVSTTGMMNGIGINDSISLEQEADTAGVKALQMKAVEKGDIGVGEKELKQSSRIGTGGSIQRKLEVNGMDLTTDDVDAEIEKMLEESSSGEPKPVKKKAANVRKGKKKVVKTTKKRVQQQGDDETVQQMDEDMDMDTLDDKEKQIWIKSILYSWITDKEEHSYTNIKDAVTAVLQGVAEKEKTGDEWYKDSMSDNSYEEFVNNGIEETAHFLYRICNNFTELVNSELDDGKISALKNIYDLIGELYFGKLFALIETDTLCEIGKLQPLNKDVLTSICDNLNGSSDFGINAAVITRMNSMYGALGGSLFQQVLTELELEKFCRLPLEIADYIKNSGRIDIDAIDFFLNYENSILLLRQGWKIEEINSMIESIKKQIEWVKTGENINALLRIIKNFGMDKWKKIITVTINDVPINDVPKIVMLVNKYGTIENLSWVCEVSKEYNISYDFLVRLDFNNTKTYKQKKEIELEIISTYKENAVEAGFFPDFTDKNIQSLLSPFCTFLGKFPETVDIQASRLVPIKDNLNESVITITHKKTRKQWRLFYHRHPKAENPSPENPYASKGHFKAEKFGEVRMGPPENYPEINNKWK